MKSAMSGIIKRSVVLNGHKTSVSLENEFWEGLREIAEAQKTNLSSLVRQVDRNRGEGNLSSAIRVHVFKYFHGVHGLKTRATAPGGREPTVPWSVDPATAT